MEQEAGGIFWVAAVPKAYLVQNDTRVLIASNH